MPESNATTWEVISRGARVKVQFDTIGDQLTGKWEGFETIIDPRDGETEMRYANFTALTTPGLEDGEAVSVSASYQLEHDLKDVPIASMVRLTYTRDVQGNQKGRNPLKVFTVEVARG